MVDRWIHHFTSVKVIYNSYWVPLSSLSGWSTVCVTKLKVEVGGNSGLIRIRHRIRMEDLSRNFKGVSFLEFLSNNDTSTFFPVMRFQLQVLWKHHLMFSTLKNLHKKVNIINFHISKDIFNFNTQFCSKY